MLNVVGQLGDFSDPNAEMMEWFRTRLVDAVDEFWARNPGDVGFFVEKDGRRSSIVLNYVRGRGYHLLFKGPGDRVDWKLVQVTGSDEPVEIYFGGEPELVPAAAFVKPDEAWDVVAAFASSGARPTAPPGSEWCQQMSLGSRAERFTFEQGNENAPDSPWGYQRVSLTRTGELEYERRAHGETHHVRGTVDQRRVGAVLQALARTSFPNPPERTFLPGSSVITLSLDPPNRRMPIDFFNGQKMDGYGDVIREMVALRDALRENNHGVLAAWQFARS